MIDKILKKSPKKIIEFLASEGEKSLTEIAEELDMSKPGASKHLKMLKSIEIVNEKQEKSKIGIETFYSLNHFMLMFMINPGGKSIIAFRSKETFSPQLLLLEQIEEGEFKKDLKIFLENVMELDEDQRPEYIILFGSVARGEGIWKSDIDLCLLYLKWSELDKRKIEELISQVVMNTNHIIKPYFLNLLEFEHENSMLNKEIKDHGLVIHGNIYGRDELWREMKQYKSISL